MNIKSNPENLWYSEKYLCTKNRKSNKKKD